MAAAGENGDVKEPQVFVLGSTVLGVPTARQVAMKLDGHHLSLIYLLLGVALLGIFIEAGLIYHLYNRPTVPSDPHKTVEYMKAEKNSFQNNPHEHNEILPEKIPEDEHKPAAFLQKVNRELHWTQNTFPTFVNGLEFINNSLYIQEDGCYYIFSKISFLENCSFLKHQVMYITGRYSDSIELMKASRYLCNQNHRDQTIPEHGNSYLGGIFKLVKGDSVFVHINNHSLVYGGASENFFGAFKIH